MFARSFVRGLLLLSLSTAVVGCGNPSGLDSVQVSPVTQALTVGQTAQFTATGTFGNAKHPSTADVTDKVAWGSTSPGVATVSATGLVTAVAAGTTNITASTTAFNGPVSSSATLAVTAPTASPVANTLTSVTIIPSSISVNELQDTGQFLAIGTFSTPPYIRDLTNSPTVRWFSSKPNYFPVNTNSSGNPGATAGIVTAYQASEATITVEATSPSDGTVQTATSTFSCCGSGGAGEAPLLATLTVYNEGLNTTTWLVTADSATGTKYVLHCGPGTGSNTYDGTTGQICTATYPIGSSAVLDASGAAFGGWSYNCKAVPPPPDAKPGHYYCKVDFPTPPTGTAASSINVSVGVIFNN